METPLAIVKVSAGATLNLGNYESARYDISISRSCVDTPEAIDSMHETIRDSILTKIATEAEKIYQKVGMK